MSVNTMYLAVNNHHNHTHNQRVRRYRHRDDKDEGFDQVHQQHFHYCQPSSGFDPQSHATPDHHLASAGSLRRHIAATLMRRHQSAERNKYALQPISPASYVSSLETQMAPFNPAATPESSIELRGRIGDPSYSFKTSTELLKVLNHIWTLEEQHSSNVSLVKGLRNELDHARAKIKELLRDQQANRLEIDQLTKRISLDNLARKSKDHERIDAALQSVRDELENERKLRKRSESLHRKLARKLFEVKVALSSTVEEHEKKKNSTEVLEELCDKFAYGIIEYARQVHSVKQISDAESAGLCDRDNLILHMSESWLDERLQMKDGKTRQPVVEKLKHELESFRAVPRDPNGDRLRRRSLESIPEAVTAPQDSAFSSKASPSNNEEREELALRVKKNGEGQSPSVQISVLKNTPQKTDSRVTKTGEETQPTEINMLQKSDIYEFMKEKTKKGCYHEEGHGSNSKTAEKLISELLLSEGGGLPPEIENKEVASENPAKMRNASSIRQRMVTGMTPPDPKTPEPCLKSEIVKERSLKARSKGESSLLKILKGSS